MNVYAVLTPIVLFFIVLEIVACWILRKQYISFSESVTNFGAQIGTQTVNVLIGVAVYFVYGWLYENFRIATIELNWFTFLILFAGIDFIFYWVHRWGHEINLFWAIHSPHHSSEEMNLIIALRTGITQRLLYFMFFWVMTIIGFHPADIYLIVGIHVFTGFFYHTEFVRKLWQPIEYIFVTPSHHRVHHAVNRQYLDKNYGEFFIIWDRIFGTFAEEKEKPAYGILDHPKSCNPIMINFHYFIILWKYAAAAPFWWDKIRIWFMPAGWIPRGLERPQKPDVTSANQIKFSPQMYPHAKPYLTLQVLLGIALMLGVISNAYNWNVAEKWIGAFLLWWQIVNWSGILQSKHWLWHSETLRNLTILLAVIVFNGIYAPSILLAVIFAVTVFSLVWTTLYFRPQRVKFIDA